MDFRDFPKIIGKSGKYEIHPPKLCAPLPGTAGPSVASQAHDGPAFGLHTAWEGVVEIDTQSSQEPLLNRGNP